VVFLAIIKVSDLMVVIDRHLNSDTTARQATE